MRLNKTLLLISIFATLIIGCEDDTQKLTLKDARKAVKASQYDLAVKKFKELLQLAPNEYNGLWGLADVYGKQGNYVEQEKLLDQILANEEYKKSFSKILLPALEENYVMQGNNLLGADVKKAEGFYRKALELNKKNALANSSLAELLMNRGDASQKASQFQAADDSFREALKLRISSSLRKKLKKRAELSEFFVQRATILPEFKKLEAALVKEGLFDSKAKRFTVQLETEIAGGKAKGAEAAAEARRAGVLALVNKLTDLVWRISGKPRAADSAPIEFKTTVLKGFAKNQSLAKKGKGFTYKASVQVARDALLFHVIDVKAGQYKKTAQK